ncbi:signal peptidase I [Rhodoplanes sp. Z2-YC6860]|uniref:signal peptidase I n=1 Tax=Rhodoplanes sp. Z2-YC6860 TaxID=674703 RepID=UPI00078C1879|nr:signal peptidase I [Rhodoplanes sp. Z2-YC6860]AMN44751.1 signal peptidase I [Rhodoplanes sp. Z2-YC6860]
MPVPRAFHHSLMLRTGLVTVVAAVLLHFGFGSSQPGPAFAPGYNIYSVPSTSMAPTLQINDYVMAFGRREVTRGDVVAYLFPKDGSTVYIKRVVGLPGDRIQMKGGVLQINGEPVKQERLPDAELRDDGSKPRPVRQYLETLPGGVSHRIYDEVENGFLDNTAEVTVPAGHYFMMGDNRDNSSDSRVAQHGPVPAANILCHPTLIYFSLDEGESAWRFWRWPRAIRWGRMFSRIA